MTTQPFDQAQADRERFGFLVNPDLSYRRIVFDDAWVGRRITDFEEQTSVRAAFVTRFGKSVIPTESTVLQHGDALYGVISAENQATAMRAALEAPEARD